MVKTRLSSLSINEDELNKAKLLYGKALKGSGFNKNLKCESMQATPSRKAVWFNPACSVGTWCNVTHATSNLGKIFLKLVRKHFHKQYCYKKMFNTNTIKLSYSCTPNVKTLRKQRKSSIMKSGTNINKKDFNCRNKANCPLDVNCLVECIVYEATVSRTLTLV